ncbi:MAG: response regulator [Bacteroidota bacterium]
MTNEISIVETVNIEKIGVRYEHVMLVDDDPLVNMLHGKLLDHGMFAKKVSSFNSAQEALEFLSQSPLDELPSVIFLDILMPGMDGFGFLDAFAKLNPQIVSRCKVVMLSSSESFDHLNKANRNRYVRKFLNKPLTHEMLNAINI